MKDMVKGDEHTKRLVFVVLFLVFFCGQSFANDPLKEWLAKPSQQDFPQSHAVIVLDDEKHTYNADGTGMIFHHRIIKILDDKARDTYGEQWMGYKHEMQNLKIHTVRTMAEDGKIYVPDKEAMKDGEDTYSDYRWLKISMPHVEKGAVLEIAYSLTIKKPFSKNQFWLRKTFQSTDPILKSVLSITMPETVKVNYVLSRTDKQPEISKKAGNITYFWSFENMNQVEKEEAMPSFSNVLPTVIVSTFPDWDSVASWWRDMIKGKMEPSKAIQQKTKEILQTPLGKEDPLRAIYNDVAQNTRYVAISIGERGFEPQAAENVLKNKYGDCKDHAVLLISLLSSAGYEAYPVLIDTGSVTNWSIPHAFFNHAIVALKVKDSWKFLDSTSDTTPYGALPFMDQGRDVLIVTEKGGIRASIPPFPPEDNSIVAKEKIILSASGDIEEEVELVAKGGYESYLRTFKDLEPKEIENAIGKMIAMIVPGAEIVSYEVSNLKDLNEQAKVRFKFRVKGYAPSEENEIRFQLPSGMLAQFIATSSYSGVFAKEKRNFPVNMDYPSWMILQEAEVELPSGFEPKLPEPTDVSIPIASFQADYKTTEGKLFIRLQLKSSVFELSTDDYPKFRQGYFNWLREEKRRIKILKKGTK